MHGSPEDDPVRCASTCTPEVAHRVADGDRVRLIPMSGDASRSCSADVPVDAGDPVSSCRRICSDLRHILRVCMPIAPGHVRNVILSSVDEVTRLRAREPSGKTCTGKTLAPTATEILISDGESRSAYRLGSLNRGDDHTGGVFELSGRRTGRPGPQDRSLETII